MFLQFGNLFVGRHFFRSKQSKIRLALFKSLINWARILCNSCTSFSKLMGSSLQSSLPGAKRGKLGFESLNLRKEICCLRVSNHNGDIKLLGFGQKNGLSHSILFIKFFSLS